LGLATGV
jgi:ribonuclease HI